MQYRMVAIDLDDTLLNVDRCISERNKKAIHAAIEKGVEIVLASGRPVAGMIKYCHALQLYSPVIATGGAVTLDPITREVYASTPISDALTRRIVERLQKENYYLHLYDTGDYFKCEHITRFSPIYHRVIGIAPKEVGPFLEQKDLTTFKILGMDTSDRCEHMTDIVNEEFGDAVFSKQSFDYFAEVYRKDTNKGTALKQYAESKGLTAENVIAIGDSGIDLAMLEYAGLGVAMANASQELLDIADQVTASNNDDGVAQVIEEFIL